MLKALGNFGIGIITSIFKKFWQFESAPRDWRKIVIVKVPRRDI